MEISVCLYVRVHLIGVTRNHEPKEMYYNGKVYAGSFKMVEIMSGKSLGNFFFKT